MSHGNWKPKCIKIGIFLQNWYQLVVIQQYMLQHRPYVWVDLTSCSELCGLAVFMHVILCLWKVYRWHLQSSRATRECREIISIFNISYRLDGQFCIEFAIVVPSFTYKMVDNTKFYTSLTILAVCSFTICISYGHAALRLSLKIKFFLIFFYFSILKTLCIICNAQKMNFKKNKKLIR